MRDKPKCKEIIENTLHQSQLNYIRSNFNRIAQFEKKKQNYPTGQNVTKGDCYLSPRENKKLRQFHGKIEKTKRNKTNFTRKMKICRISLRQKE